MALRSIKMPRNFHFLWQTLKSVASWLEKLISCFFISNGLWVCVLLLDCCCWEKSLVLNSAWGWSLLHPSIHQAEFCFQSSSCWVNYKLMRWILLLMEYQNTFTAFSGQKLVSHTQHPVKHLFLVSSLLESLCPYPIYVDLEVKFILYFARD